MHERTEFLSKDRISVKRQIYHFFNQIYSSYFDKTANYRSHCKYLERFCNMFEKVPSLYIHWCVVKKFVNINWLIHLKATGSAMKS